MNIISTKKDTIVLYLSKRNFLTFRSSGEHLNIQSSNLPAAIRIRERVMGEVAQERFTGVKATEFFPVHAIKLRCVSTDKITLI